MFLQVVGTVSVSEFWGPRQSGWMHGLAVHPESVYSLFIHYFFDIIKLPNQKCIIYIVSWRRRGVGAALVAAVRAWAARGGLESLECVASELQPHARALTHAAG